VNAVKGIYEPVSWQVTAEIIKACNATLPLRATLFLFKLQSSIALTDP